ncbi:MAG: hypothetical protein ACOYOQ_00515 [Microthrixaceae bacterium]
MKPLSAQARRIATDQRWGDIHSCKKLASNLNVWEVSASGHGGLVFPLTAVPQHYRARLAGVTYTIVKDARMRRSYVDEPLSRWYRDQLPEADTVEWVVAEEDCDWAIPAVWVPGVADALAVRSGRTVAEVVNEAHDVLRRYRPEMLRAAA